MTVNTNPQVTFPPFQTDNAVGYDDALQLCSNKYNLVNKSIHISSVSI